MRDNGISINMRFACLPLLCVPLLAQDVSSSWYPVHAGNRWIYEHEYRYGSSRNPQVTRWQTVETISGTLAIPEGTVVLRDVKVEGDIPGGWLQSVYGESHYLLRNDCLYFLNGPQFWNDQQRNLQPQYRAQLLAGDVEPEFCFPLELGKTFGKDSPPGWVPSRVVGTGEAFDVLVHLFYADETHLWFKKGTGITALSDRHNGTYGEYRIRLVRFEPK